MRIDPGYCTSSYLMYRAIVNEEYLFSENIPTWYWKEMPTRTPVCSTEELDTHLRKNVQSALENGPVALMLSSGMDSAILARYLPKGTQTYTLRCRANSGIDETDAARFYAEQNHLKHSVVDVYWEDFEKYTIPLMRQKGYPIHSIEIQIYKASLQAKAD